MMTDGCCPGNATGQAASACAVFPPLFFKRWIFWWWTSFSFWTSTSPNWYSQSTDNEPYQSFFLKPIWITSYLSKTKEDKSESPEKQVCNLLPHCALSISTPSVSQHQQWGASFVYISDINSIWQNTRIWCDRLGAGWSCWVATPYSALFIDPHTH